jgi:NDP-sugar pyrophosphorylase family protein
LDEKCQIQSFEEKTNSIKNSSRLINAGIYVFSKNIVAKMPLKYLSLEKDIFPYLCGNGLYGLETNSKFIDIGIPDEYQKAQNFFTKFYIKW